MKYIVLENHNLKVWTEKPDANSYRFKHFGYVPTAFYNDLQAWQDAFDKQDEILTSPELKKDLTPGQVIEGDSFKYDNGIAVPLDTATEEENENAQFMREAKTSAIVLDWFDKWCEKTKRSGGVLITTSIKELLCDFYNDNCPPPDKFTRQDITDYKKELEYAMAESKRLSDVAEFWQKKYLEQNPGWQPPKLDNF